MSTDTPSSVNIQTKASPIPSVPAWFGEVALLAHTLTRLGLLTEISDEVRCARKRFGTFEVIDFVVVLIGYAISGEPTLAAYYERLQPFATAFMALFGRNQLPHRSTLSRLLAALDQASVEALRSVFLQDALARPGPAEGVGGLWDRQGQRWVVFDLDGTRQAARQRALPQGPDLPPPQRRLLAACAPGYTGPPPCSGPRSTGWPVWRRSHCRGSEGGWGQLDDAWQRLRAPGAHTGQRASLCWLLGTSVHKIEKLYQDNFSFSISPSQRDALPRNARPNKALLHE